MWLAIHVSCVWVGIGNIPCSLVKVPGSWQTLFWKTGSGLKTEVGRDSEASVSISFPSDARISWGLTFNQSWEAIAYYNVLKSYPLHGTSQHPFGAIPCGFNFFDQHCFIDAKEEASIPKGHLINQCVWFGIKILIFWCLVSGIFYTPGEHRSSRCLQGSPMFRPEGTGLEEAQAGIKIPGRNINNLRYADDTTIRQKLKKN